MRTVRAALVMLLASGPTARAAAPCPVLPSPQRIVRVETEPELQAAVRALISDTTILIADGTYDLTNTLHVTGGLQRVELRGESANRDAVVLRGRGMTNPNYGNVPHGILITSATDVLVADLTIRDVWFHAVQIAGEQGATRIVLHGLHLLDAGEQLVKGSTAGSPGPYADDCVVQCCLLEYTDRAPSWYTNGVDVLAGARWIVRDNVFRRIRAPVGQLAGPAVLFWRNSIDTRVERNLFLECDRGVALGLSTPDPNSRDNETTWDHQGGLVANNMFFRSGSAATGDVALSFNYCRDAFVSHNTCLQQGSFPWTIEWRFGSTTVQVANNLTDGPLLARDGASAVAWANVDSADASWFVDAPSGNLHLLPTATPAIDQSPPISDVADDFDGDARPAGAAPDIGADELRASCARPALEVTGLRVTRVGTDVVLAWDDSPDASLYNAWYVPERLDGALTRVTSSPPAIGVTGCAEPTPTAATSCADLAAVGRAGAAVQYYNVRATCGGLDEGP